MIIIQNFRDLIVIIMRALVIPLLGASGLSGPVGMGGISSFPGRSGNVAGSPCGSSHARTALLARGPVRDCSLVFRLDTSPCLLLPVPHVKEQMGRSYFGNVEFLFGMAFPRFWSSFDGSASFRQIGIRRTPVIGKIDSRYILLEQGSFGTDQRDSVRKANGAYFLSDTLLSGQ